MKTFFKFILTLLATFITIIPALMIAGAYGFIDPQGFLQGFFVVGVGVYFLGWTQLILFIGWSILMYFVWRD